MGGEAMSFRIRGSRGGENSVVRRCRSAQLMAWDVIYQIGDGRGLGFKLAHCATLSVRKIDLIRWVLDWLGKTEYKTG